MFNRVPAKVDNHRVKTLLKPLAERSQIPLPGPSRRNAVLAIQLLPEDLVADLSQILERLVLVLAFRQQVIGRFKSQVFKR